MRRRAFIAAWLAGVLSLTAIGCAARRDRRERRDPRRRQHRAHRPRVAARRQLRERAGPGRRRPQPAGRPRRQETEADRPRQPVGPGGGHPRRQEPVGQRADRRDGRTRCPADLGPGGAGGGAAPGAAGVDGLLRRGREPGHRADDKDKDYTVPVTKLAGRGPQAFAVAAISPQSSLVAKAIRTSGFAGPVSFEAGAGAELFLEGAGTAGEGMPMVHPSILAVGEAAGTSPELQARKEFFRDYARGDRGRRRAGRADRRWRPDHRGAGGAERPRRLRGGPTGLPAGPRRGRGRRLHRPAAGPPKVRAAYLGGTG